MDLDDVAHDPREMARRLRGRPAEEVAAAVRDARWAQLGALCALDGGPELREALLARADRVLEGEGRPWETGVLGLLLGVAALGPLPARLDRLLPTHLGQRWASDVQDPLENLLRALPVERREAVLLADADPAWPFLHTCPTDRVTRAAARAAALSDARGRAATGDPVVEALVGLGRPDTLAEALAAAEGERRRLLALALGRLDGPEARLALAALVDDEDEELARRARHALAPPSESATVREALRAARAPFGWFGATEALDELARAGEAGRFAEVLVGLPPAGFLCGTLGVVERSRGAGAVARELARTLPADHPEAELLFDWLAFQDLPPDEARAVFERALADPRPRLVAICRDALRRRGLRAPEPRWTHEVGLADDDRFARLARALYRSARLGCWTVALWRRGRPPLLIDTMHEDDEEEGLEAAIALEGLPGDWRDEAAAARDLLSALSALEFEAPGSLRPLPCPDPVGHLLRIAGSDLGPLLRSEMRALLEALVAASTELGLEARRLDARLVQCAYDDGLLLTGPRAVGLIWYVNDQ